MLPPPGIQPFVFTGAEYGAQYTVTVTASHGTGWAQYTETGPCA